MVLVTRTSYGIIPLGMRMICIEHYRCANKHFNLLLPLHPNGSLVWEALRIV